MNTAIKEALRIAVAEAIEQMGVKGLKKTSLFLSNERVAVEFKVAA